MLLRRVWHSSKVLPCPLPIILELFFLENWKSELDNWWFFVNIYAYQKGIAQLKSVVIPFFIWIYQVLMSVRSKTYANDVLDEFNVKMNVSNSGTTCKILQYLAEPSKVLQKCRIASGFYEIDQILSIYEQPWRLKVFSVLFTTVSLALIIIGIA